jgi:hypothetical protein
MTNSNSISNLPPRYWYTDGLPDIFVGLGFWLMAVVFANLHRVPGVLGQTVALPLTGLAISLFAPWSIRQLRAGWLKLPPLQYAPRPSLRFQVLSMGFLVPQVVALGVVVARLGDGSDLRVYGLVLFGLGTAVFISFVPLLLGFIAGTIRYYLIALPIMLTTFALISGRLQLPDPGTTILFIWSLTGLSFLLGGILALVYFTWRTRIGNLRANSRQF